MAERTPAAPGACLVYAPSQGDVVGNPFIENAHWTGVKWIGLMPSSGWAERVTHWAKVEPPQ